MTKLHYNEAKQFWDAPTTSLGEKKTHFTDLNAAGTWTMLLTLGYGFLEQDYYNDLYTVNNQSASCWGRWKECICTSKQKKMPGNDTKVSKTRNKKTAPISTSLMHRSYVSSNKQRRTKHHFLFHISLTPVDTADTALCRALYGSCGIGATSLPLSQSKQQWNPSPAAHPPNTAALTQQPGTLEPMLCWMGYYSQSEAIRGPTTRAQCREFTSSQKQQPNRWPLEYGKRPHCAPSSSSFFFFKPSLKCPKWRPPCLRELPPVKEHWDD